MFAVEAITNKTGESAFIDPGVQDENQELNFYYLLLVLIPFTSQFN